MQHYTGFYLTGEKGNNRFCYQNRLPDAKLRVAPLIQGDIKDIKIGDQTAFSEEDNQKIPQKYLGLEAFIKLKGRKTPIYIFDNHNHALYFRYKEAKEQHLGKNTLNLIHIDQHSDLNENPFKLNDQNLDLIFDFVQTKCNVGNFIKPAIESGLIKEMKQIRSEYGLLHYENSYQDYILDIDLDFWADEMKIEHEKETLKTTRNLIPGAKIVTIATSPYFLNQEKAIKLLYSLLEN